MRQSLLRRIVIFVGLVGVLLAVNALKQAAVGWHYVVSGKAGQVIYVATFDAFQDDWHTYLGRLKSQIIENRVLRVEMDESSKFPFAEAKPTFGDFDLRVQATPTAGPENNGYGVIFRLQNKGNNSPDDDEFYAFLISSDGYYQVLRARLNPTTGKQEFKELSTWIPSDAVQTGIGSTNWLRVVAKGDQFQFYVNNQPMLLCIPDDPNALSTYVEAKQECKLGQMLDTLVDNSISTGQIAVVAQSLDDPGVAVDFDNVVVFGVG